MSLIDDLNKQQKDINPDASSALMIPSELESEFGNTIAPVDVSPSYERQRAAVASSDMVQIPLLGARKAVSYTRFFLGGLVVSMVVVVGLAAYAFVSNNDARRQVTAAGDVLLESSHLTRDTARALVGVEEAFADMKRGVVELGNVVEGLDKGNSVSPAVTDAAIRPDVDAVARHAEEVRREVDVILQQEKTFVSLGKALSVVTADIDPLGEHIDALKHGLVSRNAAVIEVSAVGDMQLISQRILRATNEFLTPAGISPENVFALGKDLTEFEEILSAFEKGNIEAGIRPLLGEEREILKALRDSFAPLNEHVSAILANMQGVVVARQAEGRFQVGMRNMTDAAERVQQGLRNAAGVHPQLYVGMAVAAAVTLLFALALVYVQVAEVRRRQERAEEENSNNQTAILRLMNELQSVAEGDLTQEATVTEDITGSIADSVNVTVEELRSLVGNVQVTADQVANTTHSVETTSNALLEASTQQLEEIRHTGQSVLDMATRITGVSAQAHESAAVAQKSREAAEQGGRAVQDTINGMNVIRDQIQETSKRIKRLGESSQEIGEITELISDITEQTNVLALNAAIQAASAGEAGRGFSVVAEEVQRLAERSAEATRQIAALVKTIQADTSDAIAAMERSTQGVVQGAQLSDNAGQALAQIDQVSKELAELIARISETTDQEARSANDLAANIQQIFLVTEQTGQGTRSTVQQVRELARVAQDLRTSVARFKIS